MNVIVGSGKRTLSDRFVDRLTAVMRPLRVCLPRNGRLEITDEDLVMNTISDSVERRGNALPTLSSGQCSSL